MAETEVTESWREKIYEEQYTMFFFDVGKKLVAANLMPTIANVQTAFSAVRGAAYMLIYDNTHVEKFQNQVRPPLNTVELVLFGNQGTKEVQDAQSALKVMISTNPKTHQKTIVNMQNVIKELWEAYFLVKQWAYEMGFFAKKPFGRKYGKDAIDDIIDM
jgi:hypothetical protein